MNENLKPCPRCGSANLFHSPSILGNPKRPKWAVVCEDCGFSGRECGTTADADCSWNKRAAVRGLRSEGISLEGQGCGTITPNNTCDTLRRRLNKARRQEDVDKVVKAAKASNLSDEEFQALMRSVLNRRRQLPERN